MDIGLVLALLTGCVWAGIASGYSAAARRRLSIMPFVAIAASTGAILSASVTIQWSALPAWREAIPIALVISLSGLMGQSCMLFSGAAMTVAPNNSAATWTIMQTAMIIPFLASTLSGREHASWVNWLALPVILFAFHGLTPQDSKDTMSASQRRSWLALLVAAFFLSGASQALAQEISLRGWQDVINLRPMLCLAVSGVFLWIVALLRRELPTRQHWLLGGLTGLLVAVGNLTLFDALDASAAKGRAYLVFPMAVGSSVFVFALCQLLIARETFHARKVLGLACGLAGILLLGLR